MGRERRLTDEQISEVVAAYEAGAKAKQLAETYHVSVRTVQRTIRAMSAPRKRGRRKHEYYSRLATYVSLHPAESFPRSLRKIAERTESSIGAVKAYLYRRRKDTKAACQNVDFKNPRWKYVDTKGRTIPAKAIADYTVTVESWTNIVRLNCTLKGEAGRAYIRLPKDLIARLSSTGSGGRQ